MRLQAIRKEKGYTQKELCNLLGIGQSTLSGWENGKISVDGDSLVRLCGIFNVSSDYLLELSDDSEGQKKEADTGEDIGELVTKPDELALLHTYQRLSRDSQKQVSDLAFYQYTTVEKIPIIDFFARIIEAIHTGENKLNALAGILQMLRNYYRMVPAQAVRILLDVIIEALQHYAEIPDEAQWSRRMGSYFAKNTYPTTPGFFVRLKAKFESGTFSLSDMIDLTLYIREHHEELDSTALERLLRNPEVTLRDDARPRNETALEAKCSYYAEQVEAALEMVKA